MRIRILIPVWQRKEVTRFCFERIPKTEHQIDVTVVLSEQSYIPICEEFGFDWVFAENDPLGEKINTGLKHCLKFDFDYLMMMNSDGVIKGKLFDYYKPFFESNEAYFGVNDVTYVNFETKEAVNIHYEFSVLGTGKMLRRDVLEKTNGELYNNDLNRGLDDHMMDKMVKMGHWPKFVNYEGQLVYDYKSDVNIWPWETFKDKGKKVCYSPDTDQEVLTVK